MGPTKTKKEAIHNEAWSSTIYIRRPRSAPVCWTEISGYLRINELRAEFHGKPVSEHIGCPIREVLPALAPILEPMHRQILETGEAEVNVDVHGTTPAQPGVERDWLASHYPLVAEDGTVLGTSVMVHEITDRKLAERKLRESEERLRLMADTLPALVAYVDSDQRYRFQNAAYRKWFGIPREKSSERFIKEIIGERMYERVQPCVEKALSGRTASLEVETPRPGGQMGVLQATLVPNADEDGKVLGFYVLAYDITERKQAEEALRESAAALRRSHAQIQLLAGKLIAAQEEERKRVARELHDDIN